VLDETVAAMEVLGARRADIAAAVGPCIAQKSYQVGPEFPAPFHDEDATNQRFFAAEKDTGHFRFDLQGYVRSRLQAAGVGTVSLLETDTCPAGAPFFSYRRSCLNGEPDYGRCLSAISLKS